MTSLVTLTTPKLTKYIPHYPTTRQIVFLLCNHIKEVLYGGAAGGGKSDAMLMAALQYVDVPHYRALIFRRTFADLALPGAIMNRSYEWLANTDAHWSAQDKTWTFPSGATLTFGYLEHEKHKFRYQSSEFQFIGFDELTQFTETQYTYLFSRLRKSKKLDVPLRMRSATNPGGTGHIWVKQRFIDTPNTHERVFVPAKLDDNPHLDKDEYEKSLQQLDMVTRQRLKDGDWDVNESGGIFKREWFKVTDNMPPAREFTEWVRFWDLAGTEPSSSNPDPDYTVGLKAGLHNSGRIYVTDVKRLRANAGTVESTVQQTAELDGKHVTIAIEQEPGSSGKAVIEHYQLKVLRGYAVKGIRATGSKLDRARPVSAFAESGHIILFSAMWNADFLTEVNMFTDNNKGHDDQVDALSGAYDMLSSDNSMQYLEAPDWFFDDTGHSW
ncbi:MAG: phage terminase large subunit [Chloroflexota bacterium]